MPRTVLENSNLLSGFRTASHTVPYASPILRRAVRCILLERRAEEMRDNRGDVSTSRDDKKLSNFSSAVVIDNDDASGIRDRGVYHAELVTAGSKE